jgi:hypothetical protein
MDIYFVIDVFRVIIFFIRGITPTKCEGKGKKGNIEYVLLREVI